MELRKLVFLLAASLLLFSTVSAQSIQVEGLTAENINYSANGSHVTFSNQEYLNKSIIYRDLFIPEDLNDDLHTISCGTSYVACQGSGQNFAVITDPNSGPDRFYAEFWWLYTYSSGVYEDQYDPDGDVPQGFGFLETKREISVGYNQGNTGLGQLLNTSFNYSGGQSITIDVDAHYEHLILEYTFRNTSGDITGSFQDVYSGKDTEKLILGGEYKKDGSQGSKNVTYDNLYEPEENEIVYSLIPNEANITGIDWRGLNHSETSIEYSNVKSELSEAGIRSDLVLNDTIGFDVRVFNVSYPENSEKTFTINYSYSPEVKSAEEGLLTVEPPKEIYTYIVGSGGAISTDSYDSEGEYTYSVPDGADRLNVTLLGAGGGYAEDQGSDVASGGKGGRLEAVINVSGISSLTLRVGGDGIDGSDVSTFGTRTGGGFNGGGDMFEPNEDEYTTSAGGGMTDIRIEGTSCSDVVAAAGGGGGGEGGYGDAAGGGLQGEDAEDYSGRGGDGGTQSSGGSGGSGGEDGSKCQGGDGYTGTSNYGYAGGGAGWYGGGAGQGGAGGSSYGDSARVISYTTTTGGGAGVGADGSATIKAWSTNKAPKINSTKYVEDRREDQERLVFGLDAAGESDISGYNGLASAFNFTNSTLKSSVSLPFTSTINVSDSKGAFSSNKVVDLSETDSGRREDDYSHSLSNQRMNRSVTISNNAEAGVDYELVLDLAGSTVQGQSWSGTISGSSSVTHTAVTEADWITDEYLGTYNKYSDVDFDHGEDTQRIHNRTEFLVDNTRSFTFHGVDISGKCSQTSSADISSGTSVRVTSDCTRPVFKVDVINESTSTLYEDTGYSHSLGGQGLARNKTVNETGGYSLNGVNVSAPSLPGSVVNGGMREVNLSAGGSATEIYNSTGDWIKEERQLQAALGQDLSRVHDVDQQYLYNQTRLVVNNTRSFGFSSVDLSNTCSVITQSDISAGESTVTSSCSNDTISGDWIANEENKSTSYVSGPVSVGKGFNKSFTATQEIQAANVRTSTALQVDVDSLLSENSGCSVVNSTQQEFDADSFSSFTFHKSCSPGSHLNRTPVTKTEAPNYYKYSIEFGFKANSNLTEEQDFRYAVKKKWADQWNSRDPTLTEAVVDGSNKDITIEEEIIDGTEYIVFVIGDEHTNSSIHEGTHSATLTYYESKSQGTTSGGGGGGSTTVVVGSDSETQVEEVTSPEYNWTVSAITSEDDKTFQLSGYPGSSFEKYVVVRNTGDSNVTLDIDCVSRGDSCRWVNLSVDRVVLNRNSFSKKTVTVNGTIPETFDGEDAPARFSIRVSDPRFNGSQSTSKGVGFVDFTVTYSPVFGPALDVAKKIFEVRELESPVPWGHSVPYPFLAVPFLSLFLVVGAGSVVEWLIPRDRTYPTVKWSAAVIVFLIVFIFG